MNPDKNTTETDTYKRFFARVSAYLWKILVNFFKSNCIGHRLYKEIVLQKPNQLRPLAVCLVPKVQRLPAQLILIL